MFDFGLSLLFPSSDDGPPPAPPSPPSSGIDPALQALLDQNAKEFEKLMETWQQAVNDQINLTKRQTILQLAQNAINKQAESSFNGAGDALLGILKTSNKERERLLGATTESYDIVPEWTNAKSEEAPKVDRNDSVFPWDKARDEANFWNEVDRRVNEEGVKIQDLPETINGYNVEKELEKIGVDKNNPKPGDEDKIAKQADSANEKAEEQKKLEEAYKEGEVTQEDIDNFLDNLAGTAESKYTEELAEAEHRYNRLNFFKGVVEHAANEGCDDGKALKAYIFNNYYNGEALYNELQSLVPFSEGDDIEDILDKVNAAHDQAKADYEAVKQKISEEQHSVPGNEEPEDPNAWEDLMDTESEQSAMSTASAMLNEYEDLEDLEEELKSLP